MTELLLMCMIAGRRAAISAIRVQSVIEIDEITPIPGSPDFICGLTALRSQALTVVDCALALGLDSAGAAPGQRAAVIEVDGHLYALLLDDAYDVGESLGTPVAVPGGFGSGWQNAACGMVETEGGPTLLVDIESLVAGPIAEAA